ncbi:hypothetical protein C8035_v009626 [Colletotrichum spinosum]|uniref:Uncharacterized protein n=1 Tax=Colletotrichum spinosum TaxID=1347390 RepID=A0A4R8QDW9_9PEZI|nr:hypothetical protein C8035_v009626 [Colletotrichum spinosum]
MVMVHHDMEWLLKLPKKMHAKPNPYLYWSRAPFSRAGGSLKSPPPQGGSGGKGNDHPFPGLQPFENGRPRNTDDKQTNASKLIEELKDQIKRNEYCIYKCEDAISRMDHSVNYLFTQYDKLSDWKLKAIICCLKLVIIMFAVLLYHEYQRWARSRAAESRADEIPDSDADRKRFGQMMFAGMSEEEKKSFCAYLCGTS